MSGSWHEVMPFDRLHRRELMTFVGGAAVLVAVDAGSALAAKAATTTIPIVFGTGSDPVRLGLVETLNRPGGNATGVLVFASELGPKRLQLLSVVVTHATVIAL